MSQAPIFQPPVLRRWNYYTRDWNEHAAFVVFATPGLSTLITDRLPLLTLVAILPRVSRDLMRIFSIERRIKYIERALVNRLVYNNVSLLHASIVVHCLRYFGASITGSFFLQMLLSPVGQPSEEEWPGLVDLDIIPNPYRSYTFPPDYQEGESNVPSTFFCPDWCCSKDSNEWNWCGRCRIHISMGRHEESIGPTSQLEAYLCDLFTRSCNAATKIYATMHTSMKKEIMLYSRSRSLIPNDDPEALKMLPHISSLVHTVKLDFITAGPRRVGHYTPPRFTARDIVSSFDIEACRAYCTFGDELFIASEIFIASPISILTRNSLCLPNTKRERIGKYTKRGFTLSTMASLIGVERDMLQFLVKRPDIVGKRLALNNKRKATIEASTDTKKVTKENAIPKPPVSAPGESSQDDDMHDIDLQ